MSKGDWIYLGQGLFFLVLALVCLLGMLVLAKDMQDASDACERAGGVMIQMSKCVQSVEIKP